MSIVSQKMLQSVTQTHPDYGFIIRVSALQTKACDTGTRNVPGWSTGNCNFIPLDGERPQSAIHSRGYSLIGPDV